MRPTLPVFLAALAGSAAAVTINIYPNSENCDDNSGGLVCENIPERVCCHNEGNDIFSAKFIGMDINAIPDQVSRPTASDTSSSLLQIQDITALSLLL